MNFTTQAPLMSADECAWLDNWQRTGRILRKKLPESACAFIELLKRDPAKLLAEAQLIIQGSSSIDPRQLADWLSRRSGARVFIFMAVARQWGLHDRETRGLFLALPRSLQTYLNDGLDALIAAEREHPGPRRDLN